MGMRKVSLSHYEPKNYGKSINPDPSNFNIRKYTAVCEHLVVLINYPDAKNFEGEKILLFENTTIEQLRKRKSIDPHFAKNKSAPIARFKPNKQGWDNAIKLARLL